MSKSRKSSKERKSDKFMCIFCGYRAKDTCELYSHLRCHLKERPYFCALCPKSFVLKSNLTRHVNIVHKNQKPFDCGICGKAYYYVKELQVHSRAHTGFKPYTCNQCGKHFTRQSSLNHHIKFVHPKDPLPVLTCDLCSKSFLSKNTLKQHVTRSHKKIKPFKCDVCAKAFFWNADLVVHQRVHTGDKPFSCWWWRCGKQFSQKKYLNWHLKAVHKKERRQECLFCGKRVSSPIFEDHVRNHTGERVHSCSWCENNFVYMSSLNKHEKVCKANPDREVARVACDQCQKTFTSKGGLVQHVARVHEDVKKYKCPACYMTFYTKTETEIHIRSHTKDKPFACSWPNCGKAFSRKYNLKDHVKRVHDKFGCVFCGSRFSDNRSLEQHVRRHIRECSD